jgi:phospholipase/carboxylesterase
MNWGSPARARGCPPRFYRGSSEFAMTPDRFLSTLACAPHLPLTLVRRRAAHPGAPLVVLLHGFMGTADDLAPFASSLGVEGEFVFPEGLVDLGPCGRRGRAWWAVDGEARQEAISHGPRDLSGFLPEGIDQARAWLMGLLKALRDELGPRALFLGGFSQGAMLSCDLALRNPSLELSGLVLFSGARIAETVWAPLYAARRGLRVFISHGRHDEDLSFAATESFQHDLGSAGWVVTWQPFDGGHEIPFAVWRAFRTWMKSAGQARSSPQQEH